MSSGAAFTAKNIDGLVSRVHKKRGRRGELQQLAALFSPGFWKPFEALIEGRTPRINGDDYNTEDGTNVRDYVHVADIAAAHVVAAQRLAAGEPVEPAYNLGSQNGLSVKQIMDAMARVTGIHFTPVIGPRRAGDPDRIVATGEIAPDDVHLPGIYVHRIVLNATPEKRIEQRTIRAAAN